MTPTAPANGGQCVIDIVGNGYRQWEVQQWQVTGPPVMNGQDKIYPMTWSTSGFGSQHTATGNTTWTITAAVPVHLMNKQLANNSRLIGQEEGQQTPDGGVSAIEPGSSKPVGAEAFEFLYPMPKIPVAANATVADANHQFLNVTGQGFRQGPAKATVTCQWHSVL